MSRRVQVDFNRVTTQTAQHRAAINQAMSNLDREYTQLLNGLRNMDGATNVNCESWRNHQTWSNFDAFPGVLTIGEHNIATGFNLTPHGNIMPGAYPGPTMPNAGRRPGGGWFVGGHMCLYFNDSTGGTPGAQAMEKYAFNFFNR